MSARRTDECEVRLRQNKPLMAALRKLGAELERLRTLTPEQLDQACPHADS